MTFTAANFIPNSSMANSNAPRQFNYNSGADNIAAVIASGYFDEAAVLTGGLGLKDKDLIYVQASDGERFLAMAVSGTGVATVTRQVTFA